METWDAIRTRRNVREFDDRPIPPDDLDRIVAAAALAPSSMNEQRWAFVVCRDDASLEELSHAGDYADHVAGAAAAIAFLTPRVEEISERESIAFDLGQAVENAMLAAWELGIGSCHASVYDEPRVRELLAYPPEMTCDLVVSFGYPADPGSLGPPGSRGGRKPLPDLRHDERF
jgi:nitroreductase